jgi:hypothetical protein
MLLFLLVVLISWTGIKAEKIIAWSKIITEQKYELDSRSLPRDSKTPNDPLVILKPAKLGDISVYKTMLKIHILSVLYMFYLTTYVY